MRKCIYDAGKKSIFEKISIIIKNYFLKIKCPACKSRYCLRRSIINLFNDMEWISDSIICFSCDNVFIIKKENEDEN
jgi:hypothetical protein